MQFNESRNCQCNAFLIKGHFFSKCCLNSNQSAIFKPTHKARGTNLHLLAQPPCPVAPSFSPCHFSKLFKECHYSFVSHAIHMLQYFNQHQFKIHQQNRMDQSEPTITIFLVQLL